MESCSKACCSQHGVHATDVEHTCKYSSSVHVDVCAHATDIQGRLSVGQTNCSISHDQRVSFTIEFSNNVPRRYIFQYCSLFSADRSQKDGTEIFDDRTIKVKVSSYVARYPVRRTAQSAVHIIPWQTCSFQGHLNFSGKYSSNTIVVDCMYNIYAVIGEVHLAARHFICLILAFG